MKTNNLDNSIKEKLQNRRLKPSASAWERLSAQLDEQPKQKKKGWFFYIGAAASILLLIGIGVQFLSSKKDALNPKEIIVNSLVDTIILDKKIDTFINEVPIEKAIVKVDGLEEQRDKVLKENVIANRMKQSQTKEKINSRQKKQLEILKTPDNEILIAKVEEKTNVITIREKTIKKENLKQDPNSRIKINSEDLLFAVTHSAKEVKEYYAKYNVNREDVLKTIKSELKKSNIKINPNTILAEVERTIGEEEFQNKFMKSLKRRVNDIATAIASRND